MKKVLVTLVFALLGMGLFAQKGLKLGIHGGLPLDEFQDELSLVAGVDLGYRWGLSEIIDLGVMVGFVNGFPEKYDQELFAEDLPNIQFMPLAASVRFWTSNSFSLGGDIGQAIGINDGNEGGLYYRPIIAYLMGAQTEVNLSYTGIAMDGATWSTINLGVLYTFDF
ncbi:hypothetical protein DHD05_13850 [Arenibacter sp. N53]|jgi:hypothetical protein|uniref:hypothetical protein n=1 Tax=Arenibacter TaxID=178469 RepID=UPI000CD3BDE7|nr:MULTISPECIES: hypothetical protein [Arenibacter]MCM4152677.1 hypothetical protein [Arenibacter sp. N53]|tara:strand:+ start:11246 stop:11746 length:501 start_codon:yes stop_codon:yes gene_type:complete